MKQSLESTDKLVTFNNVPARIWEGQSESGIKVQAFLTRIAIQEGENTVQFEKELQQVQPPSEAAMAIPLRMII